MIAIYREATSRNKSTKTHLLVRQDYSNRTTIGPNFAKDNILLTLKNGKVQDRIIFNRTELSSGSHAKSKEDLNLKGFIRLNNDALLQKYEELEAAHYQEIKDFYKTHKTAQKALLYENWVKNGSKPSQKPKKMYVEYQGKPNETHKEFLIAFGGEEIVNKDKQALESIDNPEFYNKCVKAAKRQLEFMGLTDRNLVSIIMHRDENTQHFHIKYTNLDYKNCQSLNVTQKSLTTPKTHMTYRKNLLSNLQKELNKSFGFEFKPMVRDQQIRHKTKREWLIEQNTILDAQNIEKQTKVDNINNQIKEKNQILTTNSYTFDFENLAKNYKFEEAKKKIEEIEKIGLIPANPENKTVSLIDEFIKFIRKKLIFFADKYLKENKDYSYVLTESRQDIEPILERKIQRQILR